MTVMMIRNYNLNPLKIQPAHLTRLRRMGTI
jgi:hypothetical protein